MRKVKGMTLILVAITCLFWLPQSSYAETNGQIQLEDMELVVQELETSRQPLTNYPIELIGPEQEKKFYYEIHSTPTSNENQLVLHLKHSGLLIAPSSVTISVDDEPVVSKPINGEQLTDKIIVPLTGKALEKGFHSVTVSFYGVMKEGICVDQDNAGNWLTIGIESYFQLSGQQKEGQQALSDYPSQFIGTDKHPVAVVLPDNASTATLDSGMKVAAYLAEQTETENSVRVVRESKVEKIAGNVIFIGAQTEFQTPFMKDIIGKAALPEKAGGLILSSHTLVDGTGQAQALFVTAQSPEEIEKRIAILTVDQFMKQLSGQQMTIQTIPEMSEIEGKQLVPLAKFGMPNITLDRFQTASEQFFYYAPAVIQPDGTTTLALHLKRSETIALPEEDENAELLVDSDVELTVLVNDVPHSINMRTLTAAENDLYTVQIPITADKLNENRLISLQFVSSGLRKKNPCMTTDENRWIYIADDSFFTFPEGDETETYTLAKFPAPFIDGDKDTVVILPDNRSVGDNQLLSLYRSMRVGGQAPQWKLALAEKLTADDVKDQHVIFLGGPDVQPLLQDRHSDLAVSYDKDVPDLTPFGFLQEATALVSWIQPSLWSEQQYAMMVFDHVDQAKPYMNKEILDFLKNTDEVATVAVKANNGQVYTNALQFETNPTEVKSDQSAVAASTLPIWWIVGFLVLIIFAIIVIFFMLRKRKRREV